MDLNEGKAHSYTVSGDSAENSSNGSRRSKHSKFSQSLSSFFHKKLKHNHSSGDHYTIPPPLTTEQFGQIKEANVVHLPQTFQVHVLGSRPCHGEHSIELLRDPIDDMMSVFSNCHPESVLTPATVTISPNGLKEISYPTSFDFSAEKSAQQSTCSSATSSNFSSQETKDKGYNIKDISYGAQDLKRHQRVFGFTVVNYYTDNVVNADCHAYLCENYLEARRMALSLKLAYKVIQDQINYTNLGTLTIEQTVETCELHLKGITEVDA